MYKIFKTLFLYSYLIIYFIKPIAAHSQSNNDNFHQLNIHGVLFNKKVNILFEDSLGFLWIGTSSGLYKYDGHSLTQYINDVFNPVSIQNNNINSIIEDDFHNLWIGSESYLIHFDVANNAFKGFFKNATSIILGKTSSGEVLVNFKSRGITKITPNEDIHQLKLPNIYSSNSPYIEYNLHYTNINFIQDNFNRNWYGTPDGIVFFNDKKKMVLSNFRKRVNDLKSFDNNKFIATTNIGIYILGYNKSNNKLEVLEEYTNIFNDLNTKGTLLHTTIDHKNNDIWISTTNGLINGKRKSNQYNFNLYSKNLNTVNLLNNNITSTIFDSYGNLWIGSFKGINKYIGRTSLFSYIKSSNQTINQNNVSNSLYYLKDKDILIGMNDGLYRHNKNKNTFKKINTSINHIDVITQNYEKTELLIADRSTLYKSKNYNENVNTLELNQVKKFKNDIKDVLPLNKNETWVILWSQGLDIINNETPLSNFKKKIIQQLKNTHPSVFLLTKENKLWIGTRGEGIYIVDLNEESIKHHLSTIENGLTSNAILCLYEGNNGNVWIGTRGGGLNLYDKNLNIFKNFKKSKESTPNIISSIQEDMTGNIWASTQDGITKYDLKTNKFINFGIEDGVNENQFIFNSSTTNKTKKALFFGSSDGFYTVFPNKYIPKKNVPTTVITNFSIIGNTNNNSISNLNKIVNLNRNEAITLPYNQNNISITFSSLDLTTPNKNEYAYKLKGLNDYWIHTSAFNRNANYNGLAPGVYTFMVKSSNSDGIWNKQPTTVKFVITPPYWKSQLAYLLYFILLIITLYVCSLLIKRWYRLKENLVKETISREKDNEHNRMKMIFFTDISHELRTPLSLILGSIEKVVKEKKFTLTPITSQRIYNNTLRMQRLINQIMDIRKFDEGRFKLKISKNDIVKDILIIKNAFNGFANNSNIKYNFISIEKEIIGWYDVDILEKILFNLLSNAFKHTQKNGEIIVSLELHKIDKETPQINPLLNKGTYIKCSVKDNGVGIPKEELNSIFDRYYQANTTQKSQIPGTGIGMELVQKLTSRHHGLITVESEENVSTIFTFYIPINKNKYSKKERIQTGTPLKKNFIKSSEFQIIEEISPEKGTVKKNTKPTILIVEDHDDLRTMVKDELCSDFNIIEACNGKEGYDIAVKEQPQLIISDILMPVEDGVSMLKRIKKTPSIYNIPIFMLTAKHAEETKIECLSLGANDYIEKPFSLEFLKWKLKNTFATRKELKEKYSKLITTAPSSIETISNDEKFIKKTIKIIEDNMTNHLLNVEFLATEVGMSRANLYRKVQTILDDTPVNFIKTIKLKRAVQLLKKNQMYISEVAHMTGFNNQKYFSKCFHKEYGMSPTEFIKKNEAAAINENPETN